MKRKFPVEQLLRWRFERAKTEAPPAPGAASLLTLARPWWEKWPEKYQRYVEQLNLSQIVDRQAKAETRRTGKVHPVPALVVHGEVASEVFVKVVNLGVCDSKLQLRFRIDTPVIPTEPFFEVTFISETAAQPFFAATATMLLKSEYHIDTQIPRALAKNWEGLEATDRLPFRLILRFGSIA